MSGNLCPCLSRSLWDVPKPEGLTHTGGQHSSSDFPWSSSHLDCFVFVLKVLFHEDGSVKGIATNDVGIAKDGSPKVTPGPAVSELSHSAEAQQTQQSCHLKSLIMKYPICTDIHVLIYRKQTPSVKWLSENKRPQCVLLVCVEAMLDLIKWPSGCCGLNRRVLYSAGRV